MPPRTIKPLLFSSLLALLWIPLAQHWLTFVNDEPLHGYFRVTEDTVFSLPGWFGHNYQEKKEGYLNDHVGLRPDLVRIKDQVDFSLFSKATYGGAVLGNHHDLFFAEYLNAYNGVDYSGYEYAWNKLTRLKALQDTLARLGKTLVLVYAPNKAFCYPEEVPENMRAARGATNYGTYARISDSLSINTIDCNKWFKAMKDTAKGLILSKAGTHWTVYGSIVAQDSIARYIERMRGIRLSHPATERLERLYRARQSDDDIQTNLNLIWPVSDEQYTYPALKYPDDSNGRKLKAILIGDSFAMNLLNNWWPQSTFRDWEFWYRFAYVSDKNTYLGEEDEKTSMANHDWRSALNNSDCVILIYTSINLTSGKGNLGNGFIEAAYDHYFPKQK